MTDNEFYSILTRCMPSYTPVEKIGTGNFGSVYKCERDGIYYAIKIIAIPSTDNELDQLLSRYELDAVKESLREKVEYYRREIRLMAELKGNRNIVNIEDYQVVESDDGLHFYIVIRMELLTSLTSYSSKNVLKQNDIIRMGIDICDALIICEKHNVIHRDIKPENILLHSDGAFKVGDFGVAKQLSKTTAGTIAGTEGFMAPEVSRGMEYGHTADIYSLGIVLYYFLNNKKMPFVAPDNKSIIAEQEAIMKRMSYTDVLPFPPNCSESLGKIVVKACMFDKNCRYRSAADMRADLIKVLNGEDAPVDIAPATERGTIVQTNPMSGISSANDKNGNSSIYTPFTGDIVDKTSEERAKSRNKSTEAFDDINKQKKNQKGLIGAIAVVCVVALVIGGFIAYRKFLADPIFMADLTYMTVEKANEILISQGFTPEIKYSTSETVGEGLVISQNIDHGKRLNAGDTIQLVVSTGQPSFAMPNVIGKSENDARKALSDYGLTCTVEYSFSNTVEKGNIIMQSIAADTQVKKGTNILLVVSNGTVSITSISIESNPTKTLYYVGEELNNSGLTLTAKYNDGSTKTISSGFTCTPTSLNSAGTKTITVSYSGKSTSFSIVVIEQLPIQGIPLKEIHKEVELPHEVFSYKVSITLSSDIPEQATNIKWHISNVTPNVLFFLPISSLQINPHEDFDSYLVDSNNGVFVGEAVDSFYFYLMSWTPECTFDIANGFHDDGTIKTYSCEIKLTYTLNGTNYESRYSLNEKIR